MDVSDPTTLCNSHKNVMGLLRSNLISTRNAPGNHLLIGLQIEYGLVLLTSHKAVEYISRFIDSDMFPLIDYPQGYELDELTEKVEHIKSLLKTQQEANHAMTKKVQETIHELEQIQNNPMLQQMLQNNVYNLQHGAQAQQNLIVRATQLLGMVHPFDRVAQNMLAMQLNLAHANLRMINQELDTVQNLYKTGKQNLNNIDQALLKEIKFWESMESILLSLQHKGDTLIVTAQFADKDRRFLKDLFADKRANKTCDTTATDIDTTITANFYFMRSELKALAVKRGYLKDDSAPTLPATLFDYPPRGNPYGLFPYY